MHIMIMEKLKQLGYEHGPADWFHHKLKSYKQQINKWEEIINALSFGVSAYSYVNNVQYCNIRDLSGYINKIKRGEIPVEFGERLTKKEQENRKFIFGLKIKISKELAKNEFGKISPKIKGKIDKYKKAGLIEEDKNYIKLTQKGALFADEICIKFYSDKVLEKVNNSRHI